MNICVFGASSDRIDSAYFEAARELGRLIGRGGHRLVFGGGKHGLMGACAWGVLEAGGKPLGIAPRFFDEPNILMTAECDFLFTETMSERKKRMEEEADCFIAVPGGIGTYEEFFEVLTLKQLGRHRKPIALLNTLSFFDGFDKLLRDMSERGFLSERVLALYALCDTPEEALRHVSAPASGAEFAPSVSFYNR